MNTRHLSGCALLALAFFSLLRIQAFAQGSLTPPGPPGATMKTLQQIEPRKEVNSTNTPGTSSAVFRISTSGSYYLSGNVTGASGKHGIEIAADDVTLDLNGFTLKGVASSVSGISVNGQRNFSIRNGVIRDWVGSGIAANNSGFALYENLRLYSNSNMGLSANAGSLIRNCTASYNGLAGFFIFGTPYGTLQSQSTVSIRDCVATENTTGIEISVGSGSVINCVADRNSSHGIYVHDGSANVVSDCVTTGNGGSGILVFDEGCKISHCTTSENTGDGIAVDDFDLVQSCTAYANGGNGIVASAGCQISDCVVSLSGKKTDAAINTASDGIEMGQRNRVLNCTIYDSAQHGIFSTNSSNRNFIEGCLSYGNDAYGIFLQGNGNTVIKNNVGGNSGGTINQSGGGIAPIMDASTVAGSMHPLANFP